MRLARWGDSLAVRLPSVVVEALGLREGDDIEIHAHGSDTLSVKRKLSEDEFLERLRAFRGRLPDDFKFDREEANAR